MFLKNVSDQKHNLIAHTTDGPVKMRFKPGEVREIKNPAPGFSLGEIAWLKHAEDPSKAKPVATAEDDEDEDEDDDAPPKPKPAPAPPAKPAEVVKLAPGEKTDEEDEAEEDEADES